MSLLQRLFRRSAVATPAAAHLALDIGTEYAKALVFEYGDDATATVTGVGRTRQGLAHMQSGTVADIPAVVGNCREALDEAEAMSGRTGHKTVIGIAGELVKDAATQAGGKGGGKAGMAQGKVPELQGLETALQRLRERLQS